MTAHRVSWLGLAAGGAGVAITVLYLGIILNEEGGNDMGIVAFVTACFALASAAALTGSVFGSRRLRVLLLGASAAVFAVWGVLAILSIGIFLLGAAALALFAASRVR